jgi:hypothetical protein
MNTFNDLYSNSFLCLPNRYYNFFLSKNKLQFFNILFFYYKQTSWYDFKSIFYENSKSFYSFNELFSNRNKNSNSVLYENSFFFLDKFNSFNYLNHIDNKYFYLLKKKL